MSNTIDPAELGNTPKKKRRIFPWIFLAVQVVFLIWIITGISGAANSIPASCVNQADVDLCTSASQAGAGIGFFLIVGLWVAVDFILGVGYLIFRRR